MANITVKNIKPAGTELFADSEGFMNELSSLNDAEVSHIIGGNKSINLGVIQEHDVSPYSSTSGHLMNLLNS